jgi:dihydroflavonol-4-reductase
MATMKNVLVTGGAGFLGSSIVKELLTRNPAARVRVLALPSEPLANLDGLDVEIVKGNVLSADDVKRAVAGCDTVFHVAAIYKDFMPNPSPMYEVALRGTTHVMQAALAAKVEKVVYTASIVALGRRDPQGGLANEATPYDAWDINFHYSRSKHLSMLLALDFVQWGLDVRVVCPGVIFGPGDIGPTPSGQLIINSVLEKFGNVYTEGGSSYVDVRDCAKVHVLAAEKGRAGQVYVATKHNLDNPAFIAAIGRVTGKSKKLVKVPNAIMRTLLTVGNAIAIKRGEAPLATREFYDYSVTPQFVDNTKSVRELGATYRPIEDTIRDAIADFKQRGLLP